MAHVRPFRGIVYAHDPGEDISDRTAPPYDVVSPEQREELIARDEHNVVALELPEGALEPCAPHDRYAIGRERWREWREAGVLVEDREALYVLEQRFEVDDRRVRRRALIAAVGLEPFSAGVIIPHERTLPKALTDRLDLLRATQANLSQVFGLFTDPSGRASDVIREAIAGEPMLRATGEDGAESRLWRIEDPEDVAAVEGALADRRIFIADGHHRYTVALQYRDERRRLEHVDGDVREYASEDAGSGGQPRQGPPAYDSVMMALVDMEDPELVVLPTHRVAEAPGRFDAEDFLGSLAGLFTLTGFDEPEEALEALRALDDLDHTAFLVRLTASGRVFLATERDDVDPAARMRTEASDAWRSLDVAVLQELVLDPLLDIHPDRPETLDRLTFVKGSDAALETDEGDVAFLLRATRLEQLREVALAGETMPQKSTYFYPKLLSGLVMRSVE